MFFLSGVPALLYQIVWQRSLFTIFGVNVESVTVVVSAFMLGLGVGSLVSRWPGVPLLALFGCMELGIAAYGLISLPLFRWVATSMAGAPAGQTFVVTFLLVLIPTLFMGATLPLLVTQLGRIDGRVGRAGKRLEELAGFLRLVDGTGEEHLAVEGAESVRRRTARARVVTDDNMAPEWRL